MSDICPPRKIRGGTRPPGGIYENKGKGGKGGEELDLQQITRSRVVTRYVGLNEKNCRVGESHHNAKLSDEDVVVILELRDCGMSYAQIAAKLDHLAQPVAKETVRDICKGITRSQYASRYVKRVLKPCG